MKDKERYSIEMSSKQMDVMRSAMEFYSRFLCGQIDHFPKELEAHMRKNGGKNRWDDQMKVIMAQFKTAMLPELVMGDDFDYSNKIDCIDISYGVGNAPIRETDIAYEMYREILVLREKENPSVGMSVYKNPTRKVSAEPLIQIKDVTRESKIVKILNDKGNA